MIRLDDDDDSDFVAYGTPLEPLTEADCFVPKAPRLEDQVVKDERGLRRFHGAFTGGFSAGYFNTVGSKEGWTPSVFVSSRSKKTDSSKLPSSNPQDFMDEEDLRDHGIAPQGIRTTSSYRSTSLNKRKLEIESVGPIPGKPVLEDFLIPTRETVGIGFLKKLGWRPGQGVGPRKSKREKTLARKDLKKSYAGQVDVESNDESDEDEEEYAKHNFAPDDVEMSLLSAPKDNYFGLGYKPLTRTNVLGSICDSAPSRLTLQSKSKSVSIRGQAFGVGAYEEEDEDIYKKDDMTNYDFVLGGEEQENSLHSNIQQSVQSLTTLIEGFVLSSKRPEKCKKFPLPDIPKDYIAKHQPRRRRFNLRESDSRGLGRHTLSSEDRARILTPPTSTTIEVRSGVKGKLSEEKDTKNSYSMSGPKSANFQPFSSDPERQKRYEMYLQFREKGLNDKFSCVQSKTMTEWEKDNEKREFERAASLYLPLSSTMSARFISATGLERQLEMKDGLNYISTQPLPQNIDPPTSDLLKEDELSDQLKAARSKMFGSLTQTQVDWYPHNTLCKRFNVPNPYPESTVVGLPNAKKSKMSIFNFLSAPLEETAGLQRRSAVAEPSADLQEGTSQLRDSPASGSEFVPDNYGLKVCMTGQPTMDLYKAIFDADSDSEGGDTEASVAKNLTKDRKQERSSTPKEVERSSTNSKEEGKSSRNNFDVSKIVGSSQSNMKASGVFKNIDFGALNQYRNKDFTDNPSKNILTKENVPEVGAAGETDKVSTESESDTSEEEYGPAAPPKGWSNPQLILGVEASKKMKKKLKKIMKKKEKEKKKRKNKKHKKDKHQKDSKRKKSRS